MAAGLLVRDATGKILMDVSSRITSYHFETPFSVGSLDTPYIDIPVSGVSASGGFYAFVEGSNNPAEIFTNMVRVHILGSLTGRLVVLRY